MTSGIAAATGSRRSVQKPMWVCSAMLRLPNSVLFFSFSHTAETHASAEPQEGRLQSISLQY